MTKQEEIDWGLRVLLDDMFDVEEDYYLAKASERIREFLDSKDIVIKVDNICYITATRNKDAFIETVAVESLIKGREDKVQCTIKLK